MYSFHFYPWNQLRVIPVACTLQTPYKKPPQIFCDIGRRLTTWQITLTALGHGQPITIVDY